MEQIWLEDESKIEVKLRLVGGGYKVKGLGYS